MLDAHLNPFKRMKVYLTDEAREERKHMTELWLEAKAHFNMAHRKDDNA